MTRLVYLGDRRFEFVEGAEPAAGPGECLLEIVATGVCGSDVHGYVGLNERRPAGTVMGHEAVGRVVEAGEGVELEPGLMAALWPIVACEECDFCSAGWSHLCPERRLYGCTPELPGAFATRMKVQSRNLVPLPPDVPPEWGALVEPLAVGHHAIDLAGLTGGECVSIVGGGAIGIAAALAASRAEASEVTVVEPQQSRRATLAALGLTAVGPEAAPFGVDLAVECVGHEETVRAALGAVRPGGAVVLVGLAAPEVSVPMVPLVIEERRVLGSSAYTRADFIAVADCLSEPGLDLEPMIERRVTLEELPRVFEEYAEGRETAVRTLMACDR